MPCYNPIDGHRKADGSVYLGRSRDDLGGVPLRLPCGRCVGCRTRRAREWAYRCELELSEHQVGAFVTLTYSDDHCPVTLQKRDLQLFLKRLRKSLPQRIKFFASGEYGDKFDRPHYHALLFGVDHEKDANAIESAWTVRVGSNRTGMSIPLGIVDVQKCTPRSIAYVAGYAAKKLGLARRERLEVVDEETGEVVEYQEPFVLMSRGGRASKGIGGNARDKYPQAWREFVVHGGSKAPVPRYLHEAWQRSASHEEIQALRESRYGLPCPSRDELAESERVATVRLSHKALKRAKRYG